MTKMLYSATVVAVLALLAAHITTAQPGEASGPSPGPASSDQWGTWQGLWTDGQGGTLRLVDHGDTLLFDVEVGE